MADSPELTEVREGSREGSLEAPTRHPIDWRAPEYTDPEALNAELARVFDICHGCRRCFSLCNAFPTLFDLVDESATGEVDAVPSSAYPSVVEHCYLCDMCYMSKCPYVPPHPWNVDFPHLMLRAKVQSYKEKGASMRDRVLSSTRSVGRLAGIPVKFQIVPFRGEYYRLPPEKNGIVRRQVCAMRHRPRRPSRPSRRAVAVSIRRTRSSSSSSWSTSAASRPAAS